MIDKVKFLKFNRVSILIILFLLLLIVVPFTYSKFFSSAKSDAKVDTAFYILKADYYETNICIDDIAPSDDVYTYDFSVLNNDGKNRAETNMEYTLKIVTTTNLPLSYALYKNEKYNDNNSSNIITGDVIARDSDAEDATYFRTLSTEKEKFGFKKDEKNDYQLVISFPKEYDSFEFTNKTVISFNEAFEYLLDYLNIETIEIKTEGEESTMSAKTLSEIIDKANEENITTILLDKNDNTRDAKIIENETNCTIQNLNSGLYGNFEKDAYINQMHENLQKLQALLNK